MWNLSFTFSSLMILIIFLFFYFSLPRLDVRRNRAFLHIIFIETIVIVLDIGSSFVDNLFQEYSQIFVTLMNMAFFIAFYARALILYEFNIIMLDRRKYGSALTENIIRTPFYISALMAAISPFTKLVFYIDEEGYHSGPMYNILYACSFFYLFMSYLAIVKYRRKLKSKREWQALALYNITLTSGIFARMIFSKMLLMDTFCIMAIIIIYLAFENPEYDLDIRGTVFNSDALSEYLEENLGYREYMCLGISIHNYHDIRDIYGTYQMDEGLYLIARYLTLSITNAQIFYNRRGKFILLCPVSADFRSLCHMIGERFRKAWRSREAELYLDVSFATIETTRDITSADILINTMASALEKADSMYSIVPLEITQSHLSMTKQETETKRSIETAIENNAIEVFLQPLINAEDGSVEGAEALSRIRDQQGSIIPPAVFIPIAEKNGRINEVGEQVFEKTCAFIKENDLKALGINWINVNLSPMQFTRSGLGEKYASIAKKYGVPPEMIHLEITEASMIDDSFLQRQLQTMEKNGFRFVLDDYGTGYSNLTRLKKCPFINIKLDMTLVWDYCREPDELLPTMIQAFKHMHFGITAEGIEDEKMADEMRKLGCDYFQGIHYSIPVPMSEFKKKYCSPGNSNS